MRPGWKTTEFYQAAAAQALALLTLLGVVASGDSQTLQDSLAKCVTAILRLDGQRLDRRAIHQKPFCFEDVRQLPFGGPIRG